METVYIETTIISYLVARPSKELVLSAHQEVTRRWWKEQRPCYSCMTSDEVVREASLGEAEMSRLRLEVLAEITVLKVDDRVHALAKEILEEAILPPQVISDAIHAAAASIHGVDILLTWNCRHLANPHLLRRLRTFMTQRGLVLPEICTPIELEGI